MRRIYGDVLPWEAPIQRAVDAVVAGLRDTSEDPTTASRDDEAEKLARWRQFTRKSSPRPMTWDSFIGNRSSVEQLQEQLTVAQAEGRPVPHVLIHGGSGTGKTTLGRLLAQSTGGAFVETVASALTDARHLFQLLRRLNLEFEATDVPGVLFVDEAHTLTGSGRVSGSGHTSRGLDEEHWLPILEDFQFFHGCAGRSIAIEGQRYVIRHDVLYIWPFTCIMATTDPGRLSPALRRRLLVTIAMEEYNQAEIAQIITAAAERLAWPLEPGAAEGLAKYSRLNPAEALKLLHQARARAVASGRQHVTASVVTEIALRLQLHDLGLNRQDIGVLKLLAERGKRGAGAAEIARALGIAVTTFTELIEPYLRQLALVEVLSRRTITSRGLAYLASIGQADSSDPTVRAAEDRTIAEAQAAS